MKPTKLIAIMAFAGFGLCAGQTFAQGNDDNDAPPKMSDAQEEPVSTDSYNEKVTIDNNNPGMSSNAGANSSQGQPEQKERLRVYSGKHDGNNIIYDPK